MDMGHGEATQWTVVCYIRGLTNSHTGRCVYLHVTVLAVGCTMCVEGAVLKHTGNSPGSLTFATNVHPQPTTQPLSDHP